MNKKLVSLISAVVTAMAVFVYFDLIQAKVHFETRDKGKVESSLESKNENSGVKYVNGIFRTERPTFDQRGWKPYLSITVRDNKITAVSYEEISNQGVVKTVDKAYEERMISVTGTNPNEAFHEFGERLIKTQDIDKVDVVTGATHSFDDFKKMAKELLVKE